MSPEEEIVALEHKLAEKKRVLALAHASVQEKAPTSTPEKELFREVLREHVESSRAYEHATPPSLVPGIIPILPTPPSPAVTDGKDDQKITRDAKIMMLVEKALMGTIEQAVKSAESESPYVLDELHDHLVDDYYQKLLQSRKINPV